jgi:hypothetical protein
MYRVGVVGSCVADTKNTLPCRKVQHWLTVWGWKAKVQAQFCSEIQGLPEVAPLPTAREERAEKGKISWAQHKSKNPDDL